MTSKRVRLLTILTVLALAAGSLARAEATPSYPDTPVSEADLENDALREAVLVTPDAEPWIPSKAPPTIDTEKYECPKGRENCKGLFPERRAEDKNVMALLINGEASLKARLQSLRMAKKSIHIEALEFTADETGHYIAEILKQKKAEGLDVRVIVDGMSNKGIQNKLMYLDLMKHGIPVLGAARGYPDWEAWAQDSGFLHPLRINMRFHEKLWIVDGEDHENGAAIVGGMNIANGYLRVGPKPYRDQDVLVKGPIVRDVKHLFDANYAYHLKLMKSVDPLTKVAVYLFDGGGWLTNEIKALIHKMGEMAEWAKKHEPYNADTEKIKTLRAADPLYMNENLPGQPVPAFFPAMVPATMQFFRNWPRHGERFIAQTYVHLITDASKTGAKEIIIANAYFLPTKDVENALKNAVRAGAHLTILTNSFETNDIKRLSIVSRFHYRKILDWNLLPDTKLNGGLVRIFEWKGQGPGFDEGLLHAKFAIFNREKVIVGSYNLDPRSEKFNSEDAIVFQNPQLAGDLARQVLENDLAKSTEITYQQALEFRRLRSIFQKIMMFIYNNIEAKLF